MLCPSQFGSVKSVTVNRFLPILTETGIEYTWRQLAQRAGVTGGDLQGIGFERLGVPVHYARPDQVHSDRLSIIVVPCTEAWEALLECAPHGLDWLPANEVVPRGAQLPFNDPVPVLFWGAGYEDGNKPFAELRPDGTVVFYADIIAAAFFMLSRWEETVVSVRDEHGRFPATASVAYKQGFLDWPVVDEYALILREWLKVLLPGWEPKRRLFSVKLSHDVDQIRRFPNWHTAIRTFGGDLLKRRDLRQAWWTGIGAIFPDRDPYLQGIRFLAGVSHEYGLGNDVFYFMADGPGPFGCGYDPASHLVKRCVEDLRDQGFEIGFHPGYDTFNDPERLAEEKDRLDAVLGKTQYGGRQHFLRFQVPNTWRHWEQIGLTYDSTMTYADHEGFRCGTCHPFRPFDVEQNRELDLWEWPLIVMDGTLRQYRGLTPEQGQARILELARRCKQVGGTFTLLWHNSSLGGEWRPWAEVYRRVVGVLAEMQGDVHSEVGTGEWTDGRCFRVAVAQFVAGWGVASVGGGVSAGSGGIGGDAGRRSF